MILAVFFITIGLVYILVDIIGSEETKETMNKLIVILMFPFIYLIDKLTDINKKEVKD